MTRTPLYFPAIGVGVDKQWVNWWDEINESVKWQDGIFFSLCALYALVSSVALVSIYFTALFDMLAYDFASIYASFFIAFMLALDLVFTSM